MIEALQTVLIVALATVIAVYFGSALWAWKTSLDQMWEQDKITAMRHTELYAREKVRRDEIRRTWLIKNEHKKRKVYRWRQ